MQDSERLFYKKLGARIRKLRKQHNLPMKYVAMRTGITFQQLQKYECGENRIAVFRLLQIAHVIGVNTEEFMNECDDD